MQKILVANVLLDSNVHLAKQGSENVKYVVQGLLVHSEKRHAHLAQLDLLQLEVQANVIDVWLANHRTQKPRNVLTASQENSPNRQGLHLASAVQLVHLQTRSGHLSARPVRLVALQRSEPPSVTIMFALVRMALGPRVPNAQQMVQKYARAASLVSIRLATNAKKICANVIMELVLRVPSVQHMANIIARVVSGSSM
jgi:hypothetical protein